MEHDKQVAVVPKEVEDDVLVQMRRFEMAASSLDELEDNAKRLSRAISYSHRHASLQTSTRTFYAESMDAHRELLGAISSSSPSFVCCEALLILLTSKHLKHFISAEALVETLEALIEAVHKCVDVDAEASITLLSRFIPAFPPNQNQEDLDPKLVVLLTSLAEIAIGYVCGKHVAQVNDDVRLGQCWRVIAAVGMYCRGARSTAVLLDVLDKLLMASIARMESEATPPAAGANKTAALVLHCIEPLEDCEIRIEFISLTLFSLFQCSGDSGSDHGTLMEDVVNKLVSFCRPGSGASKRDDRIKAWIALLKLLVRDAIVVLRCPEFPSAEPFLYRLADVLVGPVTTGSDVVLDALAIDTITSVLCGLERDALLKDLFWTPPVHNGANQATAENQPFVKIADRNDVQATAVMACPCRDSWNGTFMIECDHCRRWFHGACVGISAHMVDLNTITYTCQDCQVYKSITRRENANAQELEPTEYRKLIASYLHLVKRKKGDLMFSLALNAYSDVLEPLLRARDGERDGLFAATLSRRGASRLFRLVSNQSGGGGSPTPLERRTRYLNALLKTMALAGMAMTRCHTVKQLALVLEANPGLFQNELVKRKVEERLEDESISVREACLDLVGSCNLGYLGDYQAVILTSVMDEGLSVRKRAIRLCSKIMLEQHGGGLGTAFDILATFSARLDDFREEETVKDLVRDSLHKFFVQASVSTINTALCTLAAAPGVGLGGAWLGPFLLDARLTHKFEACCEDVMNSLRSEASEDRRNSCVKLCKIFARFMTAPDLKDLVVFIAPKPSETMAIEVCETFAVCGPRFLRDSGDEETLARLTSNLGKLATSCSPDALPSVIRAIAALQQSKLLNQLWTTFTNYLANMDDSNKRVDFCERAILTLSLLLKCDEFSDPRFATLACKLVLPYLDPDRESGVRKYALQALSALLARHESEKDMTHIANKLYQMLDARATPELKTQALCTLYDVLMEADNERKDKSESHVALLTAIVSQQQETYVALLADEHLSVRLANIKLMRAMLKRNITHAQRCVAPLVSLLRDARCYDQVFECLRDVYARKAFAHNLVYMGIINSKPSVESEERFDCFSDSYALFVAPDRKARIAFLEALAEQVFKARPELSHFICQVLARLPLVSYQEVLSLVQTLRKRADFKAGEIRARLDKVFRPVLANRDSGEMLAGEVVESGCTSAASTAFGLGLAQYLIAKYRITAAKLQQFHVSYTAKDEKLLPPSLVASIEAEAKTLSPVQALAFSRALFVREEIEGATIAALAPVYKLLVRAMKDSDEAVPLQEEYSASGSPKKPSSAAVARKRASLDQQRFADAEEGEESTAITPASRGTSAGTKQRRSTKRAKASAEDM